MLIDIDSDYYIAQRKRKEMKEGDGYKSQKLIIHKSYIGHNGWRSVKGKPRRKVTFREYGHTERELN